MFRGESGTGQWQDQTALDELFLLLHTRDLLPQSVGRQLRSERREHVGRRRGHWSALLEQDQARPGAEVAVAQRGGTGLALGQGGVQRADAVGEEPSLKGRDQGAAQPLVPPGGRHADAYDPRPVTLHPAHRGADDHVVRRGHHSGVEGLEGRHGVREREERRLFGRGAFHVDTEHALEIVRGVVPDPPTRHDQLRVFGRVPIVGCRVGYARDRRATTPSTGTGLHRRPVRRVDYAAGGMSLPRACHHKRLGSTGAWPRRRCGHRDGVAGDTRLSSAAAVPDQDLAAACTCPAGEGSSRWMVAQASDLDLSRGAGDENRTRALSAREEMALAWSHGKSGSGPTRVVGRASAGSPGGGPEADSTTTFRAPWRTAVPGAGRW